MTGPMDVPGPLRAVLDDFADLGPQDRLALLLEFADGLPGLPARYVEHPELLEPVPECASPLFVAAEVGPAPDHLVALHFSAPREAPTTRGFAGILHAGLDGQPALDVVGVPSGVLDGLGLEAVVSPLRMRGMGSMLRRIQRQVRAGLAAAVQQRSAG